MKPEEIGVLALGSHEERHGPALPLDTDAKLATYVAQEAAKRTRTKFIGVLFSSYELPLIDTGKHQSMDVVLDELSTALANAQRLVGIKGAVLVNGHGGNSPISKKLPAFAEGLGLKIAFNDALVKLYGPHAMTGELSMGAVIGITDQSKLQEQGDFSEHPEVGFVGLKEARMRYSWADERAKEATMSGIRVSRYLGERLLECAIIDVINTIREL